ncbi:transcriptional adapter ADA2a-like isoform X2 [Syzygium oleosum]|uniref:transcriptional adapter ADA2a-like isoform X2 n=1 Tax=Syzygium oleosum TaxID=219896 RepID=UPI0024B97B47|nr:transcriptional adapter ADA2a-like isoform X2 [Syzygium oleosum]
MGRSRAASRPADEDPNQRSKRKKIGCGPENAESASTAIGQGNEEKGASYHCNCCDKDISGKIRIKCAACPDFDLCIECFSVGAEIIPHKSNHPYRVMDNLCFPLLCPGWNADEEMLLLEGIEMYGFGNWAEVAEHVGSKSKSQCITHYSAMYMNSPCWPLPRGASCYGQRTRGIKGRSMESLKEIPVHVLSSGSIAGKRGCNISHTKEEIKDEESQIDRSIGEKKPRISGDEGPSATEFSGYNFKRQEFEVEYDNDAEQLLADMEFRDTDTDAERELKLQVLRIYSKRLNERKRRKDFILERNLLYPDPFEKNLSPEEKEIYKRFKVFTRFHSKEEHEEFVKSIIEEHRIVKRIHELQDARAAGCRTAAEANKFIERKREKEAEGARRMKEISQAGPSGKIFPKPSHVKVEQESSPQGLVRSFSSLQSSGKDTTWTSLDTLHSSLDGWDISDFPGADLLSEAEKRLCGEIRILPAHYLKMLHVMSIEMLRGNLTKNTDAHGLFRVEPSKVDRVYDMFLSKGIAQA